MAVDVSTDGENAVRDLIEGVEKIKKQIEAVATKISSIELSNSRDWSSN